jgi:uncharacterized membrane protein YcaP (DUF421 family)
VFIAVALGLRVLGKRQIGQFTIYDLAMIMALANAVQNAMTSGAGDLSVGIICSSVLLILGRISTQIFMKWPKVQEELCGSPRVLVQDGQLIEANMQRESITEEQIDAALREHGIASVKDAKMAVLEVDGTLSIIPK